MNALDYLRIFSPYADDIGGVHWSPDGDAVLGGDGATLALAGEIALFLEGFSAQAELMHFSHVLHLFRVLRWGPVHPHDELRMCAAAFKEARGQARNAGAFFAHVTEGVPRIPGGVDATDICRRLRGTHSIPQAPSIRGLELLPAIDAAYFERALADSLASYSFDELKHWFRHGRGTVREAAQIIVRETRIEPPRDLAGALESLLKRGRVSGAQPFLEQMISALTLPPRKMRADELPVGGYSGIATRGHPDQILPSEFAIDELEFLRRFAENELLFYRREQPRSKLREEIVVLIDQGVRTWGDVRILLSAAALAFGQMAVRRGVKFSLAATSNGGALVDPVAVSSDELAALVEASDLSANPALALESVLGDCPPPKAEGLYPSLEQAENSAELDGPPNTGPVPRGEQRRGDSPLDVIVLTHPRAIAGDVADASRRAGANTRVFALTVDGAGSVELNEMRHGAPLKVNAFKVDLARGAAGRAQLIKPSDLDYTPWTGSVEPLGFPFRFAAPHGPQCSEYGFSLAFDAEGEWLFTSSRGGLIHAYKLDGTQTEILPRGCWRHVPLENIETLVGVAGGFCACGVVGEKLIAAHYDLARRTVTSHVLAEGQYVRGWIYAYESQKHWLMMHGEHTQALALGVGSTWIDSQVPAKPEDWKRWGGLVLAPPRILFRTFDPARPNAWEGDRRGRLSRSSPLVRFINLDYETGSLQRDNQGPLLTPLRDGQAALRHEAVLEAHAAGGWMALKSDSRGESARLHVLRGEEMLLVHDLDTPKAFGNFLLHQRGLLALQKPDALRVIDINRGPRVSDMPKLGKCHSELFFEVGDYALAVYGGKFTHILRWDHGKLEATHKIGHVTFTRDPAMRFRTQSVEDVGVRIGSQAGRPPNSTLDANRFSRFAISPSGLKFISDVYGQLFMLNRENDLVAAFFVYRATVAAWLPDGTRYGPSSITGGPTTPDALGRIGRALQSAAGGLREFMEAGR